MEQVVDYNKPGSGDGQQGGIPQQPSYGPGAYPSGQAPYPGAPQQPGAYPGAPGAQPGGYPGGPAGAYPGAPGAQPGYGYPGGPTPYPAGAAPYGAGPGGYPPPMPPQGSQAMWAHLGALLTMIVGGSMCCGLGYILGWIAPLIVRNNAPNDPYVRHHASQGINFGITQAIMAVLAFIAYIVTVAVGVSTSDGDDAGAFPVVILIVMGLFVVYGICSMVFAVIGTIKANKGEMWSYPKAFAFPFTKP
ncbi:DUF4870 domain-containing protein [Streptomyces sp. URMC 123]|uniref:DUF4870 domain-containing protein n=1 Tax=Streptomyces sp. URMC 123 TaxID=3423403 RepID=UPI003F1C83F0